jgi:beta-lactamase superfamily II metal-dependent hydrolase
LKKKRRRLWDNVQFKVFIAILAVAATIFTVGEITQLPGVPTWGNVEQAVGKVENSIAVPGYLQMHMIDIGQGDSIYIKCGEKNVLIDAGNNGKGSVVIDYLHKHGVSRLDWLIATHPDSDHIGGMDEVIKSDIEIENFMMPRMPDSLTPTTKTYEALLEALIAKGISVKKPQAGDAYELDDVIMKILAPIGDFSDTNDYSVVCKFTYKNNSFLLTGDAETKSESRMIEKWGDELGADVLKVGHHGSKSSTGNAFLNKVHPQYALISVGRDNRYGHPTEAVLLRLKTLNIECLRTDFSGSIVAASDGQKINISTER